MPVPLSEYPAATIFPSDWMATLVATSDAVPIAVVTVPVVLKVVSRLPLVLYLATAKSALPMALTSRARNRWRVTC